MNWQVWCNLLVVAAVAATSEAMRETRQARECAAGEECISLRGCRPIQDLVAGRPPGYEATVREAMCGRGSGRDILVCCPTSGSVTNPTFPNNNNNNQQGNREDLLPKGSACGVSASFKVVFGEDAPLSAYPWMALLGYNNEANPDWKCGGALINDRYVLTAAHCVHKNFTSRVGNSDVLKVRLGEHNTAQDPDCTKTPLIPCAPSPQDFTPQEFTIHTTFNERAPVSDDIALIRLDRKVTLGSSVQPVCLPPMGMDVQAFLGERDAIVAGWGATEDASSSDILQAARLPFAEKATCEPHYPGQLVDEQVCFGGRGNVDSCFGDSGGPLFQVSSDFPTVTMLGIVSRGLRNCGIPGAPAVYTNVAFYRKWVADNIKP